MTGSRIDFYELLPEFYRLREQDASSPRGQVLGVFLSLLSGQANILKQNLDGFGHDLFIETCDEWVIPYIGDLVANNALHGAGRSPRADVAKTVYYRRRKGILPVIEEIARDVTGWGAHAVAFFEQLGWTQNLDHLRDALAPDPRAENPRSYARVGSVDLRHVDLVDRIDGAFDEVAHSVDVRPGDSDTGWHNLVKVGLFLWRLTSYPIAGARARRSARARHGYHFSPLGNPAPLFNNPRSESDPALRATELHVPGPIRPVALHFDTASYYGAGRETALTIYRDGDAVPASDIMAANLERFDRPPAAVHGLLSADLAALAITATDGRIALSVDGAESRSLVLPGRPIDVEEAAVALEQAIRTAGSEPEFRAARVFVLGARLFVLPGRTGAKFAFEAVAGDPGTTEELGLLAAETMHGVLSRDLSRLRALTQERPRLVVEHAGGKETVELTDEPDRRGMLEAALAPVVAGARVLALGARLLVLPGTAGEILRFAAPEDDPVTLHELGLGNMVAVDVARGRLSFALDDEPERVDVDFHYGFPADVGGGPYRRFETAPPPGPPRARFPVPGGANSLADAVAAWGSTTDPRAVIEVLDNRTAEGDLRIDLRGRARARWAVVGAPLDPFPTFGSLAVRFRRGSGGTEVVSLDHAPADLEEAAELLEAALPAAEVVTRAGALVVHADEPIAFRDEQAARTLGLGDASARPALWGDHVALPTFGRTLASFGADGPHLVELDPLHEFETVAELVPTLEAALRATGTSEAFNRACVADAKEHLLVVSGDEESAPLFGHAANDDATLIQLGLESARLELILRSAEGTRPTLLGNITIEGGAGQATVRVEGLQVAGRIAVAGELAMLEVAHTTLVPGLGLTEEGEPLEADRASIVVSSAGNEGLCVSIEKSIVGPLRVPASVAGLRIVDSIVDAPGRDRPARVASGLVSAPVDMSNPLPAASLDLALGEGSFARLGLPLALSRLEDVRAALERAIRGAGSAAVYREAQVVTVRGGRRLHIVPGAWGRVRVRDGRLARALGLVGPGSREQAILVGGRTESLEGVAASVRAGDGPRQQLPLEARATDVAMRAELQTELRRLGEPFARLHVVLSRGGFLVIPGEGQPLPVFGATRALMLDAPPPAIAGSDDGLEPTTVLEIERSTVFGEVYTTELELASEVLFTEAVRAERRQSGCVRFSRVPDLDSHTPRRYRCQPDLALAGVPDAHKPRVRARLEPVFGSERFGSPAYAQLARRCADELRTGAEDGAEMGVYRHLRQPQREADLRLRLEEYLPFGLEDVVIHVT